MLVLLVSADALGGKGTSVLLKLFSVGMRVRGGSCVSLGIPQIHQLPAFNSKENV